MFGFRTRIATIVAFALLSITACGADGSSNGPVIADGASSSTVSTAAPSSTTSPDYLTQEELDAQLKALKEDFDKQLDGLKDEVKNWVNSQGFVSDDDLQKLVDERFAALVDDAGYLTKDDIDAIVAQMKEAGMSEADVTTAAATLEPTDGPIQGIAGDNACTNRAMTDETQLLLDLGRELKLADVARPNGVPGWRQTFANWDESDLVSVSELWNTVIGNDERLITLGESARARVYWCAGTDADGTVRSGVWRHQLLVPVGKLLYNFGNGVTAQKDCHNLTIFLVPPPQTPVPPPTPTTPPPTPTTPPPGTKPPVSTTPAPATTVAPAVTVPPATSPVTVPTPPEVTAPLPAVTNTTGVKPPAPPPCNPLAAPGQPGACP